MLHHSNRAANALIAPSFRSQSTTTFTTVSSISPTAPSGLFEGDLIFATLSSNGTTTTITEPAGWTAIYESLTQTFGIYYKTATATDVSAFSYTWTLSASQSGKLVISAWANTSGIECASIGTANARNLTLNRCMALGRIGRNRNVARFNIGPGNTTITYPTSTEIYDTGTNLNTAAQLTTFAQGLSALEAGTTSGTSASYLTVSAALKPKLAIVDGNTNPYLVASSMRASDASFSTLVVPMPVGVQNNDFLVMVVGSFNSLTGGATVTGWTQEDTFNPAGRTTTILRKTASSEPSTYTVTTNGRTTIHILAFRGSATTFAQKSNAAIASTTTYSATAVTTTANNAIVLDINVALNSGATTFTTPTGFDSITYGEADQSSTAIFMKQQATAGTTGTVTSTASTIANAANCLALLYTINPA
jgi:hypothetical protein